uniref:Preproghrelin n=1 Tax=Hemitrygon akajei TaxID=2704970 RepID=D1MWY3_HEMAK|nr:preproghrelin [Hemitrygon akajei]
MEGARLLVVLLSAGLLASLTLKAEAGVSFHPQPRSTSKPSARREVYDNMFFQVEGDRRDPAAQRVPSQLPVGDDDAQQYRDLLLQLFDSLLGSGGQGN